MYCEYDWLGFEDSLGHLRSARWVSANLSEERLVFPADSLLALRSAAVAGFGVAALPCYLADPAAELRRVTAPLPDMEGSPWLLTHPDLRKVARVRTVLDFMANALFRQRGLIEGTGSRTRRAVFLSKRTEADFQEWRDQRDWTARKYALWDAGKKLEPPSPGPGKPRSRFRECPSGEVFDMHRLHENLIHVPHINRAEAVHTQ